MNSSPSIDFIPLKLSLLGIMKGTLNLIYTTQSKAEIPCEITVAIAAPATSQPNTKINNRARPMFSTDESKSNIKGVLLSPTDLKSADVTL